MTPAVDLVRERGITYVLHEYEIASDGASYGEEAAEQLGVTGERVFKTLVAQADQTFAVGIVPVSMQLDLKALAKAVGGKKAAMAEAGDVERATGYVLGGVSPLGQKRFLTTVLDESARDFETIYVSGGRRGLEIELAAEDLLELTRGVYAQIAR